MFNERYCPINCFLFSAERVTPAFLVAKTRASSVNLQKSLYCPAVALNQEYSNCLVRQVLPNSTPFPGNIFSTSRNIGRVSKMGKASKAIALILFPGLSKKLNGDADTVITARPAAAAAINFLRVIENWSGDSLELLLFMSRGFMFFLQ